MKEKACSKAKGLCGKLFWVWGFAADDWRGGILAVDVYYL
jgi:hypothetical protein